MTEREAFQVRQGFAPPGPCPRCAAGRTSQPVPLRALDPLSTQKPGTDRKPAALDGAATRPGSVTDDLERLARCCLYFDCGHAGRVFRAVEARLCGHLALPLPYRLKSSLRASCAFCLQVPSCHGQALAMRENWLQK